MATPGNTPGSLSYLWEDCGFTGDSVWIGGGGRTDFQEGDARALYAGITRKLFTLPDSTRVLQGHAYLGRTANTLGQGRRPPTRLGGAGAGACVQRSAGS